jgi:uncharacterized protein (DUF58 family)
MRPTPQLWAVAFLAAILAACAIVFARPEVLLGTALIGAWILLRQYHFAERTSAALDSLTVSYSTDAAVVPSGDRTSVTLSVRADPTALSVFVEGALPAVARRAAPLVVALDPGETRTGRTVSVAWPVAGRHHLGPATVGVTDGWFRETVAVKSTETVTVEPRGRETIHVGSGGERVATIHGSHRSAWLESGPEFESLRKYAPGDPANRIDWNATARLSRPYIREFAGKTNRPTLLLVDLRTARHGGGGETKLDSLREAALLLSANARRFGDPLGIATLDNEGVHAHLEPRSSARAYRRVRRRLFNMEPTRSPQSNRASSTPRPPVAADGGVPTVARSKIDAEYPPTADSDAEPTGAFVESLRSFSRVHADRETPTGSFADGVAAVVQAQNRPFWTILCTDDSSPRSLWESVTTLRERGHRVLVLLAPTVLFEADGLAELEAAYDRYVGFEALRLELDATDGVRALEVAPGERLAAVLAAGSERRGGDRR